MNIAWETENVLIFRNTPKNEITQMDNSNFDHFSSVIDEKHRN